MNRPILRVRTAAHTDLVAAVMLGAAMDWAAQLIPSALVEPGEAPVPTLFPR